MDNKNCPTCGTSFVPGTKQQTYCSRRCFLHTRKRYSTCPACGIEFHSSGRGKEGHKYCSRVCAQDASKRENHWNWKGGGSRVGPEGYRRRLIYPEHRFYEMGRKHSGSSRDVLEHRLVMAEHLGRVLTQEETVHHLNGDRADNRIENLELRAGRHGKGATSAHCSTCTCFTIGTAGA